MLLAICAILMLTIFFILMVTWQSEVRTMNKRREWDTEDKAREEALLRKMEILLAEVNRNKEDLEKKLESAKKEYSPTDRYDNPRHIRKDRGPAFSIPNERTEPKKKK